MARISRDDVRFLVLEGLMVLFGVLAALFVDGWREDAQVARAVEAAMVRLDAEVEQNLAELDDLREVVEHRLSLLRGVKAELDGTTSLADHVATFEGFRTPDLNSAAWERSSRDFLANHMPDEYLHDAFVLYEWNEQFDALDAEINRLVYSELFFVPERASVALAISERIMAQQLTWARQVIPRYEAFLERYAKGPG